jgi:hypothetical protein
MDLKKEQSGSGNTANSHHMRPEFWISNPASDNPLPGIP